MGRHSSAPQSRSQRLPRAPRVSTPPRPSGSTSKGIPALGPWRWALTVFIGVWIVATLVGLVRLWPGDKEPQISPEFYQTFSLGQTQVEGQIVAQSKGSCSAMESGTVFDTSPRVAPGADQQCDWFIVRIDEGDDAGKRTLIVNSGQPGEPVLEKDQRIRLLQAPTADGSVHYSFGDYHRTSSLLIWGALIAASIVALAATRGLRSLVGLAFTMAVVAMFTLPALLVGASPTGVAIVSGALILIPVLFVVHGLNWKSAAALGGTLLALLIAAGLSYWAIEHNQLRGLGNEDNLQIILYLPGVSVTGLMLCGFIIGALGVLNDVTIAQASTVNELAEQNPTATRWQWFTSAMKVGRDHIASMVYTLVLSYTGATLPLLLLLSVAHRPLAQTLTSDVMATELLRSGLGAMALTLAVPLTTIVAAWTVRTSPK
ncbi:YibE/F family protein [Corynebacterium diphtheriae]|nr:YibE/F family protein [Corynebacterium diphtheriae]